MNTNILIVNEIEKSDIPLEHYGLNHLINIIKEEKSKDKNQINAFYKHCNFMKEKSNVDYFKEIPELKNVRV